MERGKDKPEDLLFKDVDQIKFLVSSEIWENILFSCTKNEILIFLLLFRRSAVNMSQIAEYINAPLNMATGIVDRIVKEFLFYGQRVLETLTPQEIGNPFSNGWINIQKTYVEELVDVFRDIQVYQIPRFDTDLNGLEGIDRIEENVLRGQDLFMEVDVVKESEDAWGNLQGYMKQLLVAKTQGGLDAEELLVFPGLEESFRDIPVFRLNLQKKEE